ncbi:hypothetical protein HMPREF1531_01456 [Propionibacterium sp. oral taxon 192 str. F0372]|nr:hypothetical protein HMPREF1531_01456 [Propionibacterium sp. oral taxon 192 str. F0372]
MKLVSVEPHSRTQDDRCWPVVRAADPASTIADTSIAKSSRGSRSVS